MIDRALTVLIVITGTIGAAFAVGGFWWWAVLGMTPAVQVATMVTSLAAWTACGLLCVEKADG